VLVIAESPGSLAELGAFASNDTIRKTLRIIIQQKYFASESFTRFGPVERIKKDGEKIKKDSDGFVGFYPWRTNGSGNVVLCSARPHHLEIVKFINMHMDAEPKTEQFPKLEEIKIFYIIYWVIYLFIAIPTNDLYLTVQALLPAAERREIRNKMYCMQLAGWIASEAYSGKEYFFACHDVDPFIYSFGEDVIERDSARRKLDIATAIKKLQTIPKHVARVARNARVAR
jgi:hypothetical protein